ncbi:MAG: tRNA-dihydrouridine synthase family protein [Treponema sp.]|nr:tRNA-dihydrouridine synthase family protein [Treponema sp.]
MAELSHRALRELIHGFGGCDEYFTEMISAAALFAGGPFEKWYIDPGPCPEKLIFQLVGSDAVQITRAAAFLDGLECAGIDINMGCSAPLIRKSGAGAAWMASMEKAGQLIAKVRPAVRRRLSVKLRIGFQDDFDYLAAFCRRLEAEGTELIILHPRTVFEKFKRRARWEYVAALKQELGIPVAGNGDIASAADLAGRAAGPCDAVMAGRAAVRQPWIFAAARKIIEGAGADGYSVNLEETGSRFLELLAGHQPPEFHISRARRFFAFFCDNLKWGNYLKNLINREQTLTGVEQRWLEYFSEHCGERFLSIPGK